MKQKIFFRVSLCLFLAAGVLLGYLLSTRQTTRAEMTRQEAVAQQHYDAASYCETLADAMSRGDQDSLLAQYYAADSLMEETHAHLKERLSLLSDLSLSYQGCAESGGEREISETEFWKNFDLLFQVDQPLPAATAEALPDYLFSGIEETGRLVLTLTLCKSAGSGWTYQLVSLNTPPFSI
jgi:hypothetical protein